METIKYDEAKKIWQKITKTTSDSNLSFELELHKKLLDIFQVGNYYYYIFNCVTAKIEFVNDGVSAVLGYNPEQFQTDFLIENIHPEDISYFLSFEEKVTAFFAKLPPEKVLKYKVRYDYRIKKANGDYCRILQQVVTIQSTDDGGVIRTMGVHTDITDLKKENGSTLSFIGLEGEPSFVDNENTIDIIIEKEILTNREKEILKHISSGKNSAEIAKLLSLSKHTIDTHRKNMLHKTGTKSALDLIMKATSKGWI